jgi:hypothetical protein
MTTKTATKPSVGDTVALYGGSGTGVVTYVSGSRKNARVLKDGTGHETWVKFGNLKIIAPAGLPVADDDYLRSFGR